MAEDRKRAAKSETLTIRLNPRTRFVLEFVARMRGQTITTVVERALEAAGEQAKIEDEFATKNWKHYWDVSDGVRALKVSAEPELFPTYEEERRLQFAKQFKEYFFEDDACRSPHRAYVDVLWGRIDEFVQIYHDNITKDYWAAEKEMRGTLNRANVKPPKSRSGTKDATYLGKPADLYDDIPF